MPHALLTMSHSPLLHHVTPGEEARKEVEAAFDAVQTFARDFDPDLIISFAPDHYNGFFYDLMPQFCIGCEAVAIGDYGSAAGPLNVPYELANDLAVAVLEHGVDTAISLRMNLDHGGVQPLEIIYGDIAAKPVIPVFVNSVAPPFCPIARVRAFGHAVGTWASRLDRRVLFVASGGLSHDPPVPLLAGASPEVRATLVGGGRNAAPEAREKRQQRAIDTARAFAKGEADIQELAPEWDREMMRILASGDLGELDRWTAEEMERVAGHSAHEVRTWIAAYSAFASLGSYSVQYSYYRPIPEYIAGFGVTTVALDD